MSSKSLKSLRSLKSLKSLRSLKSSKILRSLKSSKISKTYEGLKSSKLEELKNLSLKSSKISKSLKSSKILKSLGSSKISKSLKSTIWWILDNTGKINSQWLSTCFRHQNSGLLEHRLLWRFLQVKVDLDHTGHECWFSGWTCSIYFHPPLKLALNANFPVGFMVVMYTEKFNVHGRNGATVSVDSPSSSKCASSHFEIQKTKNPCWRHTEWEHKDGSTSTGLPCRVVQLFTATLTFKDFVTFLVTYPTRLYKLFYICNHTCSISWDVSNPWLFLLTRVDLGSEINLA